MLVNKAQTLRGCTRCVARGLSFQERKFQEPGEVADGTAAARRSGWARSRSCPSRQQTHVPGGGKRRSLEEQNPHFLWAGCAKPVLCLGTRYWGRSLTGKPGNP